VRPRRTDAVPVGAFTTDAPEVLDLDAGLTLLSWNVHKGRDARLDAELGRLCAAHRPDLVALQESREAIELPTGYAGHKGTSFRRGALGAREGVMTLSRVAPRVVQRLRSAERELFLATPKAALITVYATLGGRTVCLLNVHGLNFDPSGGQLRRQLEDLARAVDQIDGPLLVAGDLNAWNAAREEAVRELAVRLGLDEVRVDFPGGTKGRVPGKKVARALGVDPKLHLDRVFVRGLRARTAHWVEDCEASDHVPLIVQLTRH
jgi:endonuclease/exonuclease/phosphatase (EEP) superfamily protein YafD